MIKRILFSILSLLLFSALPAHAQAQVHSTSFIWTVSTSTGATYNAYKQPACTGAFVKLNTSPIVAATFTDTGMADGEINCYLFTAVIIVNGVNSESAQSQSEVCRVVTPISPVITPGQLAVAPPTKPVVKSST